MIFESLWPLLFLGAVPVILILYLLKPKGTDYLIPSNLLWKKLLKNQESRTFFEKFVHNILMVLQILITVLLIIALMSPFISTDQQRADREILLVDTSGSMQHVGDSGRSRLEEAVETACDYVRVSEGSRFCLVTADQSGAELLAVDLTDADSLIRLLKGLECSDCGTDLTGTQEILDALESGEEGLARLAVFTDGAGALEYDSLESGGGKELHVAGNPVDNAANEYLAFRLREDGTYDMMVDVANYSDREVSFDLGLYDEGENLIALRQMSLLPEENEICLFDQVPWEGRSMQARISGIVFQGGGGDSLERDNVSWAVKDGNGSIDGLLVGEGNTFLEKAYAAVTGTGIARSQDDLVLQSHDYNVVIYDSGQERRTEAGNCLLFGNVRGQAVETLENVVLDFTDADMTADLKGFTIGVNTAYCFELPEGAESFLEYNGKCVGYYGERDGRREIVAGFDIRESDFPLRAEFPVFMANALSYLSDSSWLVANVVDAGQELVLQPWAQPEGAPLERRPEKAGLYTIGNQEYQESYVVRFRTDTESDGRADAASAGDERKLQYQKVKKTLRHLFLALALVLMTAEWILYVRRMRYRGNFYLLVRCAVLLCLILSLAGLQVRIGKKETATVFLVDLSHSNAAHREEMEEYLRETVAKMPARNVYGIVTFGREAQVEQFLTSQKQGAEWMSVPEETATNFEEAFSKALTLLAGDWNKRLVVLTDAKETGGDIRNMAPALQAGQTELLTLYYETETPPDAYLENVSLPSYLYPGDLYPVTVEVESSFETDAVLALYRGSQEISVSSVHLNRGENRFALNLQAPEDSTGSMETIRAQIRAPGDGCEENDLYNAYATVEAPPRILVIYGGNGGISGFTSVLDAAGCDYSAVSALNAPESIEEMLDYKAMILVDTYIDELPAGFLDHLETYVKDYGCGFVCCGGEDSFALGGYRDTALETVLPVEMQLRNWNEKPSMAMVMVIDRSGSMSSELGGGASNLDVAIRAATVAVDNLSDSDQVGVLTFDDGYEWQVELTETADRTAIKDRIREIDEGGGTTIKPALMEACEKLSASDVSVKHVVLLTDGMGETQDFRDVIAAYADSGITLSTVAVGEESDTRLLETLADQCGGRYYYSAISEDIPKIFAQEVFLGGDSYLQNGEFELEVRTGHELARGLFDQGWPVLYGYVAASPKAASTCVVAAAGKEDPILTVWQYGLGRTVAWNSDVTGQWSGGFAGQQDYVGLWKRIVEYAAGNAEMDGDQVNVSVAGEEARLVYRTEHFSGETQILATVMDPGGNSREIRLHAVAPGSYEASVPTSDPGLYHFHFRRTENGETQSYLTTAAAVQFSYEYKFDVSTRPYLDFAQQNGRLITAGENIWTRLQNGTGKKYALADWLLGLGILLFLADIAMRRFQVVPKWRRGKRRQDFQPGEQPEGRQDSQPEGQPESRRDSQPGEQSEGRQDSQPGEPPKDRQKKSRRGRGREKGESREQGLDTSALLKKKDQRNL